MTIWERFTNRMRDAVDRETELSLVDKLGLTKISNEALGTELERRRRSRGKPVNRRVAAEDELDAMADARRARLRELTLSNAYAMLEIGAGTPKHEVERVFRGMMRQYHPDRHLNEPEKYSRSVMLVSSLIDAYLAVRAQTERR